MWPVGHANVGELCELVHALLLHLIEFVCSLFVPDGVRVVQFADDTKLLVRGKKSDLPRIIALVC